MTVEYLDLADYAGAAGWAVAVLVGGFEALAVGGFLVALANTRERAGG